MLQAKQTVAVRVVRLDNARGTTGGSNCVVRRVPRPHAMACAARLTPSAMATGTVVLMAPKYALMGDAVRMGNAAVAIAANMGVAAVVFAALDLAVAATTAALIQVSSA